MGQIVPDLVERYLVDSIARTMPSSIRSREGEEQDLPLVDAEVGALLQVLASAVGAKRILEIGTCIGYSGIWLARALPADGMLFTMEMNEERARIAKANFVKAGVDDA